MSEVVRFAPASLGRLVESGFELIDFANASTPRNEAKLIDQLDSAWGVIVAREKMSRAVIEALPALRVIARTGAGFEGIDLEAATERGVAVLNTPGANSESVADFTLALMLGCVRRIVQADSAVRSGQWRTGPLARDLFGSTVGILGVGHIGQAVARRLRGFECRVLGVESMPDLAACQRLGVELVTLKEMLSMADVVSLHVPLTPATEHIIGTTELQLMQPHAVLINTARGALVDESALCAALREGRIAAAGLDVFQSEPLPVNSELAGLPNVVLAGHVSSYTIGGLSGVMDSTVSGILDIAEGRIPPSCLNPIVLMSPTPESGHIPSVEGRL
jgi:phosphoglycerate dehydrogenase-like enzyme